MTGVQTCALPISDRILLWKRESDGTWRSWRDDDAMSVIFVRFCHEKDRQKAIIQGFMSSTDMWQCVEIPLRDCRMKHDQGTREQCDAALANRPMLHTLLLSSWATEDLARRWVAWMGKLAYIVVVVSIGKGKDTGPMT